MYEVSDLNIATYGIQGGLGYDLEIAKINQKSSFYITPFVDMSWLVNQRKTDGQLDQNSITDIWSTLSYRVGVMIALDYRKDAGEEVLMSSYVPAVEPARKIVAEKVAVQMPVYNEISTKNVKGYFPIHPYIFFEKATNDIPPRYTLLSKSESKNFKESDLENFMDGDLTSKETNIDQLIKTYYNILNIYGDRMRENPKEKLMLRGSDPEEIDAQTSAERVKKYLVENFEINSDRISIETDPPYTPSGSIYSEESSKKLIADENRRVKFVFSNPKMTKPIEYTIRDESSIDNDMFFSIDKDVSFKSWDITITGEDRTMYFGPYSYRHARINPSELMRFLQTGKYNAKVVITDDNGKKTEEDVSFMLTKNTEIENAARYLMLFDYNSNDAINTYEGNLKEKIVSSITPESRVIVHGHTDNIGSYEGNLNLSQERANDVKMVIDKQLASENRTANIKAIGVGQNKVHYSFNNRYPEGRMYNRNVIVEIIK
ncbi:MAG: OmpA family protein [Bacteroidota bacterium]